MPTEEQPGVIAGTLLLLRDVTEEVREDENLGLFLLRLARRIRTSASALRACEARGTLPVADALAQSAEVIRETVKERLARPREGRGAGRLREDGPVASLP